MATLREIRRRISGVKNTQKITKAMKMVAAAKLRRAQESIVATRPYARKMNELLRHLVTKIEPSEHPLLFPRTITKVALVIISGDRGLCGAFNTNVIRSAIEYMKNAYPEKFNGKNSIRIITVGKKAQDYFEKRSYNIFSIHSGIFQNLQFGHAREIVRKLINGYLKGEFDKIEVIYNEFKSVLHQRVVIEQFLPIPPEATKPVTDLHSLSIVDYLYEPSSTEIISQLIPRHLNFQMWRMLLESAASEQGARMTAMNNATENASELLSELTLTYNKARQAGITKELLEIVSGAEALKKAS